MFLKNGVLGVPGGQELKTKQLREEQVQKMMALLTTKDEAMTSLEGRFSKLQRKARPARAKDAKGVVGCWMVLGGHPGQM
jgi:hypothetical protein